MTEQKNEFLLVEDAICADFLENVSEINDAIPFPGVFDEEALERHSFKTPAAFISWRGFNRLSRDTTGKFTGPAQFSVLVLTHGIAGLDAARYLKIILHRLIERIEGQTWNLPFVGPAKIQSVENLHSATYERNGIASGGIMFEQDIVFGRSIYAEEQRKALGAGVAEINEILGYDEELEVLISTNE
ncbi:MAG: hypothetical protein DSY80_08835 [Desulfocapsa sp.]|nr:MAG: hypothetical protein DSY80_08835 [Desulfocapsa sp.]